jgi:hypothetical protein
MYVFHRKQAKNAKEARGLNLCTCYITVKFLILQTVTKGKGVSGHSEVSSKRGKTETEATILFLL